MKRILRAKWLAVVLLLSAGSTAYADVLRIGIALPGGGQPPTFGGSPLAVVRNQQLLEKQFAGTDTQVQWIFFPGAGPAVNEALSNKQIDFAFEGEFPQVIARANRLDTRLLAAAGTRSNLYIAVPKGSNIKTIADLKGKRVALFLGTSNHLAAVGILKSQGLTLRDLKIINLDPGGTLAALAARSVDAAIGGMELFRLHDRGAIDLVWSTQQQDPRLTRQAALLVRTDYAQQHPEQTQKVVDALVDAAHWSSQAEHYQATLNEWSKSGVPISSWQAEYPQQTFRERNSPLLDDFFRTRYQDVANQALTLHLIRHSMSTEGWFDDSYLKRALKEKGLENYWAPQH